MNDTSGDLAVLVRRVSRVVQCSVKDSVPEFVAFCLNHFRHTDDAVASLDYQLLWTLLDDQLTQHFIFFCRQISQGRTHWAAAVTRQTRTGFDDTDRVTCFSRLRISRYGKKNSSSKRLTVAWSSAAVA